MKNKHNYLKNFSIVFSIIFIFNIFSINNKALSNNFLLEKEHLVLDLKHNIYWLRCSVGQVWQGNSCKGKAIKLTMEQVSQAIEKANEQLGGTWRLPTRKELESIVCFECGKIKINKKLFPNTPYEPFWTGEKNSWSKNFYWSVNFFTGHTFGRFPGSIPNFVRLVRNR
ncbi:MAG: hypothetical protein CFH34_01186 [Alphaproteobacteria bacterium MarineAlpha9_Bin4]|nr:hypothetical protein [Pelagibacterales bacterium]PPR26014.1 MAG: hypothetical protein CFH34_01186 [Alphaproteobacteria bacterium MarineAlpha9_Bin4]